jgi:hypothetical protein
VGTRSQPELSGWSRRLCSVRMNRTACDGQETCNAQRATCTDRRSLVAWGGRRAPRSACLAFNMSRDTVHHVATQRSILPTHDDALHSTAQSGLAKYRSHRSCRRIRSAAACLGQGWRSRSSARYSRWRRVLCEGAVMAGALYGARGRSRGRVVRHTLRVAWCVLHAARCTFRVARCKLHVPCCAFRVARCTFRVARCMLHSGYGSRAPDDTPQVERRIRDGAVGLPPAVARAQSVGAVLRVLWGLYGLWHAGYCSPGPARQCSLYSAPWVCRGSF